MPPHVSDSWKEFFGPGAITSFLLAAATATLGLGVPVLLRLRQVFAASGRDERAEADAILVLGRSLDRRERPTAVFRARLEHGHHLWEAGLAPRLIVTGGLTGTATVTEAAAGRDYLLELGVPPGEILLEDRSRHTLENLFNTRETLRQNDWRQLIIVSDPLHLARIAAMARGLSLDILPSPAACSPPREGSFGWWFRAAREAFLLHWYHVGMAYARAIRSRKLLSRVT